MPDEKQVHEGLPPTPFNVGDVVKHVNGERGTVLGSMYFDPENKHYGKRVKVALQGSHFNWALDDLVDPDNVKVGRLTNHKNGQQALVVGVTTVGVMRVRDIRQEVTWDVADIELSNDGATIVKQSAQIAALEAEIAALKQPVTVGAVVERKSHIKIKTLVQYLTNSLGATTKQQDNELAEMLAAGWCIAHEAVVVDDLIIRVVRLEKWSPGEVDLVGVDETVDVTAAVDEPAPESETTAPAAEVKPFVVTIEHPEPEQPVKQPVMVTVYPDVVDIPNTISFEEALRNLRMTAEEIIEIGNQQAFAKGKAVFEGLQNASSANASRWSPQSNDCAAGGTRPMDHFGGMRVAKATVR